jgi:hypothetical protein
MTSVPGKSRPRSQSRSSAWAGLRRQCTRRRRGSGRAEQRDAEEQGVRDEDEVRPRYINSQTQPNEGVGAAQMDRAQGLDGGLT